MKKISVLALFLVVIGLSMFAYFKIFKKNTLPKVIPNIEVKNKAKSHVGCSDIREVVEEGGKYYIACYGGVLVMDKNSGQVLSQITMDKGLGDFVTTDLLKKGNVLYIGTQDGLTIWDLSTNSGKKLSVGEGLPNGANIILKEDGIFIWIGTFDGLARLNTENNQLETFRQELSQTNSEKLNVSGIAVTKIYAYFSIVASAYSRGFVARYNKTDSTWEKFDTTSFGDSTQYARVDAFGLCNVSDGIFFVEDKSLWKISDIKDTKPQKIFTASFNDSIGYDVLCSENSLYFKTLKSTLVYVDGKVRSYDPLVDGNLLKEYEARKNKTDFKSIFGKNSPGAFYQILGVIDDNIYLATYAGFWVYNVNSDKLTPIPLPNDLTFDSAANFVFWPVEGSNRFVVFEQTCGMGCEKPLFFVCNYPNNQCANLNFSDEVAEVIGPSETGVGRDFGYYNLGDFEKLTDSLKFKVNIQNKLSTIILKANDLQWVVENANSGSIETPTTFKACVNENTYKFSGGTLSTDKVFCAGKDNSVLVGDYYYSFGQESKVLRINKDTSLTNTLNPKMTEPDYMPFDDSSWDKPRLNKLVVLNKDVYFATNRGLWVLDTSKNVLEDGSWNLVSIEDGLLSNESLNFTYVGRSLFVLTPAGITVVER